MQFNSRPVESAQSEVHPALLPRVVRNAQHAFRSPIPAHTARAFSAVLSVTGSERPWVLDSGCGTGVSTLRLGLRFPDCWVVGVDRSAARLARQRVDGIARRGNVVLVRAELTAFWRLMAEAGMTVARHYLLYPNPSPKPRLLGRRWHAHPVFPVLLEISDLLIMRTNWALYAEEFALSLQVGGAPEPEIAKLGSGDDFLSPFEEKYYRSGHRLFEVMTRLRDWEKSTC